MSVYRLIQRNQNRPAHIAPATLITGLIERLSDNNLGTLIVSSDGLKIEGIISERDIVRALSSHGPHLFSSRIDQVMTKDVITCRVDESVQSVMEQMIAYQIRHIPVLNDQDNFIGMISIRDILEDRLDEIDCENSAARNYMTINQKSSLYSLVTTV